MIFLVDTGRNLKFYKPSVRTKQKLSRTGQTAGDPPDVLIPDTTAGTEINLFRLFSAAAVTPGGIKGFNKHRQRKVQDTRAKARREKGMMKKVHPCK